MIHPVCGSCVITFIAWLQDGKRTKSCNTCNQDFELLGIEFAGLPVEVHTSFGPSKPTSPPNPFLGLDLAEKTTVSDPYVDSQSYIQLLKKQEALRGPKTPACLSAITDRLLHKNEPSASARVAKSHLRQHDRSWRSRPSTNNQVLAPITDNIRKSSNKRKITDIVSGGHAKAKEARILFPHVKHRCDNLSPPSQLPRSTLTPRHSLIYSGGGRLHGRKLLGTPGR